MKSTVLIALAVLSVSVPVAQAENRIVSPDDRSLARDGVAVSTQSPDDRTFSRSPALESSTPVQVIVRSPSGFNWADAAAGAAAAAGLAAILAALVLITVRSRRGDGPTTAHTTA
jgi:hypothetical protein